MKSNVVRDTVEIGDSDGDGDGDEDEDGGGEMETLSQLSRLSTIGNRIVILNIERPLADSNNNNNGNNYNNDKSKTKVGGGTGRQQLSHNSAINSYRVWTSC